MRTFLTACLFATVLHAQRALFEPSLSPDAKTVVFVSGGDIWSAPSAGGAARLLVAHPATESRPLYSPDGKSLAFISTRTGAGDTGANDVYRVSAGGGTPMMITDERMINEYNAAPSPDGKALALVGYGSA